MLEKKMGLSTMEVEISTLTMMLLKMGLDVEILRIEETSRELTEESKDLLPSAFGDGDGFVAVTSANLYLNSIITSNLNLTLLDTQKLGFSAFSEILKKLGYGFLW